MMMDMMENNIDDGDYYYCIPLYHIYHTSIINMIISSYEQKLPYHLDP
jgi:hypothetical protein